MKLAAEDKNKVKIMGALLAILLAILLYDFRYSGGSSSGVAPTAPDITTQPESAIPDTARDSCLRTCFLDYSQQIKYEPGRDIFHVQAAIPKLEANARPTPPLSSSGTPLQMPTSPPPIQLKFFGFARRPGELKRVFLSDPGGQRVFIAMQGDIVDRRYRLIQIQNNQVIMEDVLNGNQQPVPLPPK